jgi:hypothetical protein
MKVWTVSQLNGLRQQISEDKNRDDNRSDDNAGHAQQENAPAAIFADLVRPPRHPGHEMKADVCQPANRASLAFRLLFSAIGANKHGKSMVLLTTRTRPSRGETKSAKKNRLIDTTLRRPPILSRTSYSHSAGKECFIFAKISPRPPSASAPAIFRRCGGCRCGRFRS